MQNIMSCQYLPNVLMHLIFICILGKVYLEEICPVGRVEFLWGLQFEFRKQSLL